MRMLCTILHIFINMKLFQSQKLNKFKEASLRKKWGVERQRGMVNIIDGKEFCLRSWIWGDLLYKSKESLGEFSSCLRKYLALYGCDHL